MKITLLFLILTLLSCSKNTQPPKEWSSWVASNKARFQEKISVPAAVQFLYLKRGAPLFYLSNNGGSFKISEQPIQSGDNSYRLDFKKEELLDSKNKVIGSSKKSIKVNNNIYFSVVFMPEENKARVFLYDLKTKNLDQKRKRTFFKYQTKFKKTAVYTPVENPEKIKFQRSDGSSKVFNKIGVLNVKNEKNIFSVYAEPDQKVKKIMLMFKDLTNGDSTYGAGRYLIVDLPSAPAEMEPGTEVSLDFNYTFNPPCAVSKGFHCPMAQDFIDQKIEAGEQYSLKI